MTLDGTEKRFIGHLLSLAREGTEDRGALAELRSGLGKQPGEMAHVHRHVAPYVPATGYDDQWYYLTATLFGMYPQHRDGCSFGSAFRPLRAASDSMEARFVALLNAHSDDLADHLRHAVSLLNANDRPLDWFQFFDDLLHWDSADGCVQRRWARDFYREHLTTSAPAAAADRGETTSQEVEENE
ncbi:MAG: type I-E CRISPR-associated protein Cse2/CasB [Dehalococcoidia bacterium]|nr:type I-E CRISPR-associated protein Cse2/CasB [Dehalococcoidia bacterium]